MQTKVAGNKSEVARDRARIDEQDRAGQLGLNGLAIVGPHETIIERMQIAAEPILQLFRQGRNEEAFKKWQQSQDV